MHSLTLVFIIFAHMIVDMTAIVIMASAPSAPSLIGIGSAYAVLALVELFVIIFNACREHPIMERLLSFSIVTCVTAFLPNIEFASVILGSVCFCTTSFPEVIMHFTTNK